MITFPAYLWPPMWEHGLTDTLPWRPWNSSSSLNLLTSDGPQTPHRRSRDPWEHTKTYAPFSNSGFPGSHSPSLTSTSSTNVSTSKWVNLLHFLLKWNCQKDVPAVGKTRASIRNLQLGGLRDPYLYLIISGKISTSPLDVSVPSWPSHIVSRVCRAMTKKQNMRQPQS